MQPVRLESKLWLVLPTSLLYRTHDSLSTFCSIVCNLCRHEVVVYNVLHSIEKSKVKLN